MIIWKIGDTNFDTLHMGQFRYIYEIELDSYRYLYPHWELFNNNFKVSKYVFDVNLMYTDIFRELGQ